MKFCGGRETEVNILTKIAITSVVQIVDINKNQRFVSVGLSSANKKQSTNTHEKIIIGLVIVDMHDKNTVNSDKR